MGSDSANGDFANDIGNDDLWDQCTQAVSTIESRFQADIHRETFDAAARDLVEVVDSIESVEITLANDTSNSAKPKTEVLGQFGMPGFGMPGVERDEICATHGVGLTDKLSIKAWLNDSSTESLPAASQNVLQETVDAICGILVGSYARMRLNEQEYELRSIREAASHLTGDLSAANQLHQLAIELASALGVDRVSLLKMDAGAWRLVASSPQMRFDPRSELVLRIQNIASDANQQLDHVSETQRVFELGGDHGMDAMMESVGCRSMVVLPLSDPSELAVGECLVDNEAEFGSRKNTRALSETQRSVFSAAIGAVIRSQDAGFSQRIRKSLTIPKMAVAVIALAAVLALMFVPMVVRVPVQGRLIPRTEHVVYAPVSGQIETLECDQGSVVATGQVLCRFSSDDLQLSRAKLEGDILTVREQLLVAATRRSDDSTMDVASDRRVLEVRLEGLERQLEGVVKRQDNLVIHSPIAGTVSLIQSSELREYGEGQSVSIGQKIMRVIQSSDGYQVDLEVADDELGYVMRAMERPSGQPVVCTYRLQSAPERLWSGVVANLSQVATRGQFGTTVVIARVDPDENQSRFAADSGVVGWIHCDSASSGYVLCRKLVERLRIWGWL